jgi:8-oxo-dGTP diphosphatase
MQRVLHDNSGPSELHLSAAAIILDGDGKVLLVKENYGNRRYGPPGGLVEAGETPRDALMREVREETGIDARIVNLVGVYYLHYPEGRPPLIAFACRCEIAGGVPSVPPTGEIAEVGWFSTDHLPSPLTNLAPYAIADAVAGRVGVLGEAIRAR